MSRIALSSRPFNRAQRRATRFALAPVAAAAALSTWLSLPAHAQQPQAAAAPAAAASEPASTASAAPESVALDGITVRSRNRIEKLQDVPLSISVVQGNELERLGVTDIAGITKRAANVSWNQGNQRTSSISIRGVGKIGQTEAQDPSVGFIVDGVNFAYNALTSSFDFTDIDTVEVTRGPQGTLLGKNTSMGVIAINTRKPSFTPTADYSLLFSERDGFKGTLAAGGPVIDDLLAWRGSFSVSRQKGDVVNAFNRDNTYSNIDRVSGRVQFLLTPSQDFNARLALDLQPRAGEATNGRTINTPTPLSYSNGAATNLASDAGTLLTRRWFTQNTGFSVGNFYYGGANGNSVNNDSARPLVTGSHGAALELNWTLPDGHKLTSISAYKDYHFNAVNDEGTPFDIARNSGGFLNDYRQGSQELRISSPLGAFGGLVDYQAGLYYIDVKNNSEYQKFFGNDAGAWYANPTQYSKLDADAAGRYLLLNSLANLNLDYNSPSGLQQIRNKSLAAFGQANWHFGEALTLTTGLRLTREDRRNLASSSIVSNGSAPELNPAVVNQVNLGGFLNANNGSLSAGNTAAQLALADQVANKYFGKVISGAAGATYNSLSPAQQQQVAYAKAIRQSQIGVLFPPTEAQPYLATLPAWVISPSYKINENLSSYVSWQHGEKAGISQLVNGNSFLVKPEKTNSYELGFKSALLNKTLILNVDLFLSNIDDYQQSVRIVDDYTTGVNNASLNLKPGDPGYAYTYTTATGNVPKVQVSGLEFDGVYAGIPYTTLRFSGAYNKAIYKSFPNAAQPVENGYPGASPYRDLSGQPLAGAPKLSFNVGADYRRPVFAEHEFHTSANVAFASSYYSDTALSSYSVIPKSWTVDYAIGLGKRNKSFDVSLLVSNLFNDQTRQTQTWNSYTPALPRTFGIQFTGKL